MQPQPVEYGELLNDCMPLGLAMRLDEIAYPAATRAISREPGRPETQGPPI